MWHYRHPNRKGRFSFISIWSISVSYPTDSSFLVWFSKQHRLWLKGNGGSRACDRKVSSGAQLAGDKFVCFMVTMLTVCIASCKFKCVHVWWGADLWDQYRSCLKYHLPTHHPGEQAKLWIKHPHINYISRRDICLSSSLLCAHATAPFSAFTTLNINSCTKNKQLKYLSKS